MKQNKKGQDTRKTNILVYGLDRLGHKIPSDLIEGKNCFLFFEGFKTDKAFQDYDVVITFQSIFERVWKRKALPPGTYVDHDSDELVRRKKQLELLLDNNGFACFLLIKNFVDYDSAGSTKGTDLAKYALNYDYFYRNSLGYDHVGLRTVRDEFKQFLDTYGAAKTKFDDSNRSLNLKPICYCGRVLVGFILFNKLFFLPTYEPKESEFKHFFSLLADALVSCFKKLSQQLPDWIDEYRFKEEEKLLADRDKLKETIRNVDAKVSIFRNFKKSLCYDGELLKESVISILEDGFDFKIDPEDKLIEDFKIVDEKDVPLVLVEVKGTNRGVTKEFIYQADLHRARNELPDEFPSIVIVNTNIKASSSISDKDQEIAGDQIKNAVRMKVLVLRSFDLLNLLYLKEVGKIDSKKLLSIFQEKHGWLKATRDGFEILKEGKQ